MKNFSIYLVIILVCAHSGIAMAKNNVCRKGCAPVNVQNLSDFNFNLFDDMSGQSLRVNIRPKDKFQVCAVIGHDLTAQIIKSDETFYRGRTDFGDDILSAKGMEIEIYDSSTFYENNK